MATKNFYNENRHEQKKTQLKKIIASLFFLLFRRRRKRRSLESQVEESNNLTKKVKEKNVVSLVKMAQATRTFWTQAEALEFLTERQKINNSVNRRNHWFTIIFLL